MPYIAQQVGVVARAQYAALELYRLAVVVGVETGRDLFAWSFGRGVYMSEESDAWHLFVAHGGRDLRYQIACIVAGGGYL